MLSHLSDRVARCAAGKTVLITGAAGTIGSALARRLIDHDVRALHLLDNNEEQTFFLDRELRHHLAVRLLLGDMRDRKRIVRAVPSIVATGVLARRRAGRAAASGGLTDRTVTVEVGLNETN